MSKKPRIKIDHILRKYPELLNGFNVVDADADLINTQRDDALRRILRKHMDRCKKEQSSKTRPNVKRKKHHHHTYASYPSFDDPDGGEFDERNEEQLFKCPVCRKVLEAPVTVVCGHTFCKGCLKRAETAGGKCLECDAEIVRFRNTNIMVQDIVDKWRNLQQKSDDEIHPIARVNYRYCLRSSCDRSHNNCVFDDTNNKCQRTLVPEQQQQHFRMGLQDADLKWNNITVSDLECILCSQCLLSPVTTICGHTFCRECLARVLDHGLACPLCKTPLETTEQYKSETLVLSQALRLLATKEHQERLILREQEIQTLENSCEIPIFICTNALPTVVCPLSVYEPRYRLLTRRCLQSSTKRFGMAAKTASGDKFALYGTLLEIRDCVNREDGTYILTTIGLRRFKVLGRGEQDGYDTATVQYIKDDTVPTDRLHKLVSFHFRVHRKTVYWLETLSLRLLSEIYRCLGYMPEIEERWFSLPDGPAWMWWLIAILPLSLQLRVGFLGSTSLEKRLLAIDKLLDYLQVKMKSVDREIRNCADCLETIESCTR